MKHDLSDIALAPTDPGAQSSIVEEDRGVSSHKHGLAGLVDDVVVDPAVIRDVMYGVIAYLRLRRLKCWFKRRRALHLSKMESSQRPLTVTLRTGAATSQRLQKNNFTNQ